MALDLRTQLQLLLQLQQIDVQAHRLQSQSHLLAQSSSKEESEFQSVKTEVDQVSQELAHEESVKRQTEMALRDAEVHLKERETKLYSIKTTKEYQAALKEVAETKQLNRQREDEIIRSMEKIEELTKKNEQLAPKLTDKENSLNQKLGAVKEAESKIRLELEQVIQKRPDVLAHIDPSLLKKYEVIQKLHADVMAKIERGVCSGCSMNVPPQLANEILRFTDLKVCPSCRRMLYADVICSPQETPAA